MDDIDLELLGGLLSNKITDWYFVEHYSGNLSNGTKHVGELLSDALTSKSADQVDFAMSLASHFHYWKPDLAHILNKLLLEDWHYRHEDIVSLLQGMKSPTSVEPLYQTALKKFDYLSYDDLYGLARKCTWALSEINTNESIGKLRLLAQTDNAYIRQYANKRLEKQS